jgi:hypothetical protein
MQLKKSPYTREEMQPEIEKRQEAPQSELQIEIQTDTADTEPKNIPSNPTLRKARMELREQVLALSTRNTQRKDTVPAMNNKQEQPENE